MKTAVQSLAFAVKGSVRGEFREGLRGQEVKRLKNPFSLLPIYLLTLFYSQLSTLNLVYGAFQDQGWGARAEGMGGAFTAVADDLNSIFYNPAGLTHIKRKEISAMVGKPYAGLPGVDMTFFRFSGAYSLERYGTPALSVARSQTENIYAETNFSFSYGFSLTPNFLVGTNLKVLQWNVKFDEEIKKLDDPVVRAGSGKSNYSLDAGIILKPEEGDFQIGLMAKDINRPDIGMVTESRVPDEYRLGGVYYFGDFRAYEDVRFALDVSLKNQEFGKPQDKYNVYFGAESWFRKKRFAARAGFNLRGGAIGGSYVLPLSDAAEDFEIQMDYSMSISAQMVGANAGTHRFSFTIGF